MRIVIIKKLIEKEGKYGCTDACRGLFRKNKHQDTCMQLINRLIGKRKIWMHACNYNK
jgi:hypothetical protein